VGDVVHINGFCMQRMAKADYEAMATFRVRIESAFLIGNRRLLELSDLRWLQREHKLTSFCSQPALRV